MINERNHISLAHTAVDMRTHLLQSMFILSPKQHRAFPLELYICCICFITTIYITSLEKCTVEHRCGQENISILQALSGKN